MYFNQNVNCILFLSPINLDAGEKYYSMSGLYRTRCSCMLISQKYLVNIYFKVDKSDINEDSILSRMHELCSEKQIEIVKALETFESKKFSCDLWKKDGIVGKSCVLQNGDVFEKAGVNISRVQKMLPSSAIEKLRKNHQCLKDVENIANFSICGLSLILHPQNPMAPSVHMNYRYIEVDNMNGSPKIWWFGGGSDLSPAYLFDEDAIHFHHTYKTVCDHYDKEYYPKFKKWCDEYFFIKHRKECRGIGGIFFDDLDDKGSEEIFSFVKDCLNAFLPSYIPIILRRKVVCLYFSLINFFQRICILHLKKSCFSK